MANWTDDLESRIFTIVQTRCSNVLDKKYLSPTAYWTTDDKVLTKPQFPTVYLHLLPMVEQGQDLDNRDINAVLATVRVQISSNTNKQDVRKIASAVTDALKSLRFNIPAFPEITSSNNVYTCNIESRRIIGNADKL